MKSVPFFHHDRAPLVSALHVRVWAHFQRSGRCVCWPLVAVQADSPRRDSAPALPAPLADSPPATALDRASSALQANIRTGWGRRPVVNAAQVRSPRMTSVQLLSIQISLLQLTHGLNLIDISLCRIGQLQLWLRLILCMPALHAGSLCCASGLSSLLRMRCGQVLDHSGPVELRALSRGSVPQSFASSHARDWDAIIKGRTAQSWLLKPRHCALSIASALCAFTPSSGSYSALTGRSDPASCINWSNKSRLIASKVPRSCSVCIDWTRTHSIVALYARDSPLLIQPARPF